MSLFNLAHTRGNPCQDIRNSLGTHMSPQHEPCSMYRDSDQIVHVIWGGDVEFRATGACPVLAPAATETASAHP
ncbi:hypothetical protein [Nonomuraea sp. NPDC049141]|uniref:hypothetical protein n=1 Tax=Nonomuraea sp. NPDC049141 TaxID=3155500 RepID=UPI0033F97C55